MTRVDFYVLQGNDDNHRIMLVCKLAEKAFRHNQKVFIHADKSTLLDELDKALWHFREDSFVPHSQLSDNAIDNADNADPIQLSAGEPGHDRRVLINLASKVPPFFSRFERTLEVINQSTSDREQARERYRFYQQRGYPLQHHNM